jgi:3-mercaptopyruvate sulfurtransferase SseA
MRSKLAQALGKFRKQDALVFTCGDGRLSRYAAEDASVLGYENVRYLEGGRAGWRAAGNPTEQSTGDGDPKLLTETTDMWYPLFARSANVAEGMKQYLAWEVDLLEQVRHEPYFSFGGARSAL